MPQAIAQWVATKVVIAASTVVTGNALSVVAAVAYYGTQIAVTAAIAAGVQALSGGTPDPETAKGSLKQPMPPRIRGYGRRRLGGAYLLWEAQGNKACDVIAWHSGRVAGPVEQVWLHDNIVALTPGGYVIGSPDYGGGDSDLIHVETRLGLQMETAYGAIVAVMSDGGVWTEDHRADGIATLGADYRHAKKENLLADFPNGDPRWGVTANLSPVWDFRDPAQTRDDDSNHAASANLALQIMDFCCRADGMSMDFETEIAPALEHWRGEADICDEPVPLKGGGAEPRYWGSGYYALPDDPQNTLDKMLAACDGRLLRDEFGVWRLWVGKVREPTVWLTDDDIADYDIQGDAAAFDAVNELVPSFVSEAHKWTMIEATPWRDEPDIAMRGRILSTALPLEWVNSASLARRLAKREAARQLTPLRGALVGKLSCIRALGHRWIGVDLPDLELDRAVIECEKGGKTAFSRAAVDLPFSLANVSIDDWDPETEEDGSGLAPDRPDVADLDPPALTSATPFVDSLGETNGVRLSLIGSGPERDDLTWYVRWRVAGDISFLVSEITDEAPGTPFAGESGFVAAAASLEVGIGFETGGSTMKWSASLTIDTRITSGVPAPTSLTAEVSGSDVTIGWRYPQAPFAYVRHQAGITPVESASVAHADHLTGGLGQLDAVSEAGLDPGASWRWIRAYDDEDNPSAAVGPVEAHVVLEPDANLLADPSDFTTANWEKGQNGTGTAPVVTANHGLAPDGTLTAARVQFVTAGLDGDAADHSFMRQLVVGAAGAQHGVWWLKSNTGLDQTLYLRVADDNFVVTAKPYWQRIRITAAAGDRKLWAGVRGNITGSVASADVLLWQAHLAMG